MISICPYCNFRCISESREELAEKLAEHVTSKHDGIGAES